MTYYEFNPGSKEARDRGCLCPVLDNGHGHGCGRVDQRGIPLFWVDAKCPLHGTQRSTGRGTKTTRRAPPPDPAPGAV